MSSPSKKRSWKQGYYTPRNPDKYVGDPAKIRYLSSWEHELNRMFDGNPNILRWSSEGIAIPYIKPTDGRVHKYYPDYWIEYKNKKGEIVQEIIEVKPDSQVKRPQKRGKNKKQQLREDVQWAINMAKWESAQKFCNKYGIKFRIITESELFK